MSLFRSSSSVVVSRQLALAFGLALTAAACGSSMPVTAPASVTDSFSGTVAVQGSDSHNFTVASFGEVDVTLTAAGPPPTITMGLGVGTPSGDTCTLSSANTVTAAAGTTPQLAATAPAGTYCVQVFDVGNQAAPVAYTLTVAHP